MSNNNNTKKTKKKQYQHLTKDQRVQIQTLVNIVDDKGKRVYNNSEIAKIVGVHRSTISRELKNRIKGKVLKITNRVKNLPYTANSAQEDYLFKRAISRPAYILEQYPVMKKYIEDKILIDGWAPDVIVGYMNKNQMYLKEGFSSISVTSIYRAIHFGVLKVKKEDTRRMPSFNSKDKYVREKTVAVNKKDNSIDLRGENINRREEFGHWEMDTLMGKVGSEENCLLTLTERKTRYEIIFKLDSKKVENVTSFFKGLKNVYQDNFNKIFKTFTTDNGTEFSSYKEIMEYTNTTIYFCHPYASYEKGTNEKQNGIVRYFIPKGTSIGLYTQKEINNIADWMNDYPRKIFDYNTPREEFMKYVHDVEILELSA